MPLTQQTKGVILMTLTMLAIPLVDGLGKHLSASYSPLFIGWARYAAASLMVMPLAMAMRGTRVFPAERRLSHLLRTAFLVAAMTLYFLAIARIPLVTAISISFVAPIITIVLSVIVLKERMTKRKSLSLGLGLAGSLVVVPPGASTDPGTLLALASGICFALYLIATRHAAQRSDPVKTLTFQCVVGALLLTPQGILAWSAPAWNDLLLLFAMGLISTLCHMMGIAAFRLADASTLAPLTYVELIGAAIVGYLWFNEIPGAQTLTGATLIMAAGLILIERRQPRT